MVNVQNQIFNSVKQKIEENFSSVNVQKDFQPTTTTFPTITFYEIDNSELEHTLDYTQRKSNLAFQIDIFTNGCISGFDWLWTKFLAPIASWTGGVICSVLNELAKILPIIGNWLSEHTGIIENFSIILGSFAIAWGLVTAAVTIWNIVCTVASVVTGAFGAALTFLTSPIGLVILAIGAVIAVAVLVIKYWNNIKSAAILCCQSVVNAFNAVLSWFFSNWQSLLLVLVKPFLGAFKLIYDNCEEFRNFVNTLVQNVGQFFYDLWTNISSRGRVCWENIFSTWSVASDWFNLNVIKPISNFFTNFWNNIKNSGSNCWSNVASTWNVVSNWFDKNIISPLKNLFSSLWSKIQSVFGSTSSWFGNIFTGAYNAIRSAFSGVTNFFSGIWQNIKSTFTNIGSTVGNAIGGAFRNVVNSIINFAQNSINSFIHAINSAISVINLIPGVRIYQQFES